MAIQALGNRVVVEVLKQEEDGGILIPDNVRQDNQERSKVIAVGPGTLLPNGTLFKVGVEVGDVVFFKQFAGSKIIYKETEYLVLNEDEILAVEK